MRRGELHTGRWLMCALLFVSLCAHAVAAPRAWLDRETAQLGETITLNVEVPEADATQPDFTALKQDFDLLNSQSSRQISVVNGATTAKTLWAIALEPKRAGEITIAPIAVGNSRTAPIRLNVLPAASAAAGAGGDVFLEVTADPLQPYVQQEVRYTVKLYHAFVLTDGNLTEPQVDGLGVKKLGQDKPYSATVGARRYHVIERHYALTPERSGPVEIAPLVFRGNALDDGDPTGFFSRGRRMSARSEAVHLDVRPRPAQSTDGAWLPAASMVLQDETALPDEVHVGDPFTRTIRLQAQGLAFEQIPELTLAVPDGAEMYPDKTDARTRDDGEWLYGERVRKFAFVPNRTGTLTVPGMQVHWWNTALDRAEVAQLPPRTIRVLPAVGASAPAAPDPDAVATAPDATATTGQSAVLAPEPLRTRTWKLIAGVGFALWLITLAIWWRSRRRAVRGGAPATASGDESDRRAAFLRACALGEFAGAERALVAWARHERNDVRNLGEMAAHLDDPGQRDALAALQRARYAEGSTQGLATQLQDAFKRGFVWRARATSDTQAAALPALYPERD